MSIAPEPVSAEDAFHNGFHYFVAAVDILRLDAEGQCQAMGDYNVAWELKDDVMAGRYLLGLGFLPSEEERCIINLLVALEGVPVRDMPSGGGRASNVAAMNHPTWEPVRTLAGTVFGELGAFAKVNRAYFERGGDAL